MVIFKQFGKKIGNMEDFGIVIQARMGSTRLPGKVLMPFIGVPLLQYQIELINRFQLGFKVIIATTIKKEDNKIALFCKKIGVDVFRGAENNVLGRVKDVAEKYKLENVIRLTGDNPLVSFCILKELTISHRKIKPDLTSNREILNNGSIKRFSPKGLSIDIINSKALIAKSKMKLQRDEKEHIIPSFFKGENIVSIIKPSISYDKDLSIDTLDDFSNVESFTKKLINSKKLEEYLGY